jgi:CrcB protein
LLIGLLAGWGDSRQLFAPSVRLFLLIGVLGGFTTFSSFAYETMALAQEGSLQRGLINVFLQLFVGFAAVWIGYVVSRVAS